MTTDRSARRDDRPAGGRVRRRRVAAPLGRVAVAGLSASATFGLVATMAALGGPRGATLDPVAGTTATSGGEPTPSTRPVPVTTTTRRRIIVVDHLPATAAPATIAPEPVAAEPQTVSSRPTDR